jgi:predicted nucleic acid-binding protein
MIPRVYIDTSVIGGCLDEQFKEHSERLFTDFEADRLRAVISNITIAEVLQAPEEVKNLLQHPALKKAEKVYLDEEAVVLAEAYIQEGVVSQSNRVDAQRIAVATVYRVDILVSWNFHHIVRWSRIRAFNGVNLKRGYPQLEIRSPREVFYEEG